MAGRLATNRFSMAVIIITFTILRRFSSIRTCAQFAHGKSHIKTVLIESFRFCAFRAPLAGTAKDGRLMDALLKILGCS